MIFLMENRFAVSAIILVSTFLACWLLKLIMDRVVRRLSSRTHTEIDDVVLNVLEKPILLVILLFGIYFAISNLRLISDYTISKYFHAFGTIVGAYALIKLINVLFQRWNRIISIKSTRDVESKFILFRKISTILIGVLTFILILDQLGYRITPIITSLGIAGLAVALALQDTLANLFAGIYLMIDKPIGVGDFIKLDTGEEGFIENIGWRSTTIRLFANNLVVIPNSKLSQSVITNYSLPEKELSVYVPCGVSYDSDLEYVEKVTLGVAKEVIQRVLGASKTWKPVMRYKEFADSNINFVVVLRAEDITAQYLLSHEFIKALFRRYKQEGIEISFPMRNLIVSKIIEGEKQSVVSSQPSDKI